MDRVYQRGSSGLSLRAGAAPGGGDEGALTAEEGPPGQGVASGQTRGTRAGQGQPQGKGLPWWLSW